MSKNNLQLDRENKIMIMERVFDAPRELVWKAHTDATLIPKWWGPRDTETIVETMEVKPGGKWRYVHKGKDEKGQDADYAFYGEYKDMQEPEFITWTFNFEPIGPGHEITETVTFEEIEGGKTKIKVVSHYNTIEDFDGMLNSGMEAGATETWDRLGELMVELKK
jgi:uncharacterized protein YndB with AHSA1/START domain